MAETAGTSVRERLLADGSRLLEFAEVTSTQDVALNAIWAGRTDVAGVRADYQSAGRGRTGAAWIAPPGSSLLVSYILRSPILAPERSRELAFVAAVAVADAIEAMADVSARFKWPN